MTTFAGLDDHRTSRGGSLLRWGTPLWIVLVLLGMVWGKVETRVHAQEPTPTGAPEFTPTPTPFPTPEGRPSEGVFLGEERSPEEACLMCHSQHAFWGRFENGETVQLFVDAGQFENSVHGPEGLECVACHDDRDRYPHRPDSPEINCVTCHPQAGGRGEQVVLEQELVVNLPYPDYREMVLQINQACASCHEEEAKEVAFEGSMHTVAMKRGNREAPVCSDCHGSHDMKPPSRPRSNIPEICGRCHRAVYSSYKHSGHGRTLMEDPMNPDVPTCVDCHGVHSVRGPRTPGFRNESALICARCHADPERMSKYGISTAVFQTYLTDFHGRAVNVARMDPERPPVKEATCYDCHGVHNIQPVEEATSAVAPENLPETCGHCHKEVSEYFTEAWLHHQQPSLESSPETAIVRIIDMVYGYVLIPGVIGGFLLYIALDARKRWQERRERLRRATRTVEQELEEELLRELEALENLDEPEEKEP